MKPQIFKTLPSSDLLWTFLKENAVEEPDAYLFTKILYKQALFNNTILPFVASLESYYYESKKHYITRKLDYNKFITIIRQLCNSANINYTTNMVYNNSTYEIVYYIYKALTPSTPFKGAQPPSTPYRAISKYFPNVVSDDNACFADCRTNH